MKQFQILYKTDEEFSEELKKIKQWRDSHSAYVTIFRIYSEDMTLEHIQHICDRLDEEMPDALYLGCTSNANIMDGALSDTSIIMTCTIFEYETTQAQILQFPFDEEKAPGDVAELKKYCDANPWVQAVEMHASIMDMSMREFCNEMSGLREDIRVFGGGAFNPDMDDDKVLVFSKGNGFLKQGIVFLMLGGKDFHTYSTYISGWKPLKRKFKVTKADREILYELDGITALDVYRKYLNIDNDDSFFSNTLEFPLFLEHGIINDILRCPLAANDDGSLVMASDIEEGVTVRLSYGDPETILASVREDGQKIADFRPEVIQTFSCAARRAFWGDDNISDETRLFNDVAPTTGFYTHAEFLRIEKDMINFNATLVLVAMREGDMPETGKKVNITQAQIDKSNEKIPIIRRFVSFIEASTAELEEMNEKLALSSVTDGLTRLYNRAEIERKIRSALDKRKKQGTNEDISLIMLDIDNFKKVNDIYGHKEGDHVIQALSDVLRDMTEEVESCVAGRWGGEEFMVLLSDCNADAAVELAEKIRLKFAAISYETAGCQTASIGVTQAKDEDADTLYNRVDKALYMAKANGKNQVVRLA